MPVTSGGAAYGQRLTRGGGGIYRELKSVQTGVTRGFTEISGSTRVVCDLQPGSRSTSRPTPDVSDPALGSPLDLRGDYAPVAGNRLLLAGVPTPPVPLPGVVAADCSVRSDLNLPTVLLAHPPGVT